MGSQGPMGVPGQEGPPGNFGVDGPYGPDGDIGDRGEYGGVGEKGLRVSARGQTNKHEIISHSEITNKNLFCRVNKVIRE